MITDKQPCFFFLLLRKPFLKFPRLVFQELQSVVRDIPEIVELVGIFDANQVTSLSDQDDEEKQKSVLRSIFTKLMSASKETIIEATAKLKNRLHLESQVMNWGIMSSELRHIST